MIPVNVNEIAYFFAEDKVVFLVRNDGTRFIIPYSLEDLETKLDPATFFRVNRQYIVSVPSIRKVHHHFNYKLKIELTPLAEEDVIVSKSRTNEFKAWMNR
jgi:DNA-binding LytR/AlgR family response regulator